MATVTGPTSAGAAPGPQVLMGALADAWEEIQSRHPEVPPVVLAVGRGSARCRFLGSFGAMRWLPVRQTNFEKRETLRKAFVEAADRGDFSAAFSASTEMLMMDAMELSRQGRGSLGEVYLTTAGVACEATDVLMILLHEAAHAVATQRGIKDTSRNGRYHNQRFKTIAEELSLAVEGRDPAIGWSATTLPANVAAAYAPTVTRLGQALSIYRECETETLQRCRRSADVILDCGCGPRTRDRARAFSAVAVACTACGVQSERQPVTADLAGTVDERPAGAPEA
jgi:hypothetical protein